MEKEKSKRDECKEAKIHTLKGPITVADKDHLLPDKVSSQSDKGQTNHTIEKELTLQAHFAFGTPSNPTIQYANVAPTSSSSGKPVMSKATDGDHWQWGPSDNRGASAGGAQCSITCGREGLTMTYNASADTVTYPSIPCDVCPDGHADNIPPTPTVSRSMMDLHHSTEATVTTGRSQTFSGSLDRHTQRGTQGTGLQRPYGRRCKSTAHIILQNNDVRDPGSRSKDGMHSGGRGEHRGRPLLRGRGRHTERQPPDPPPEPATGEGWERLHNLTENLPHAHHHHHHSHSCPAALPPPPPPCCPCHHCNALYSFVTSMAHDPCHSCQPSHHHHHPSCSCMSHHFHQDPPLPPKTPPTTRTYNSHRSYEEYPTSTRRRERSKAPPPRSRSASPRPPPARRAASPPSRSPSPQHRWGPRITPVLPRRVVPRMGAAATSTAPTGTQHHPGHHHGQGDAAAAEQRQQQPQYRRDQQRCRHRPMGHYKPRPKTIHIDVYCSSSSDPESSTASDRSDDSYDETRHKKPRAVVALGSKLRRKTDVNLRRRDREHALEEKAESFTYSKGRSRHMQGRPTFITDDVNDDLQLCTSPTGDKGFPSGRSKSASPVRTPRAPHSTPDHSMGPPIPMPPPEAFSEAAAAAAAQLSPRPARPTTLAVAPQVVEKPDLQRHSSLSYLSSPMEGNDAWEDETVLPSSALSWRGSEFETSTPRLPSEIDLPPTRPTSEVSLGMTTPRPASDLSLGSLHEAFIDDDNRETVSRTGGKSAEPKAWRSPALERRRYIQKGQEDRYRESIAQRRALREEVERSKPSTPTTPTTVQELAKLPAFKNFTNEELKVISKSLIRKESERLMEDEDNFRVPETQESFKPMEGQDSCRLLDWMEDYKAQEAEKEVERKTSQQKDLQRKTSREQQKEIKPETEEKSLHKISDSMGDSKKVSGYDKERYQSMESLKDESFDSGVERKESSRSLDRGESHVCKDQRKSKSLERRDSLRSLSSLDKAGLSRYFRKRHSSGSESDTESDSSGRSYRRKDRRSPSRETGGTGWTSERRDSFRSLREYEDYKMDFRETKSHSKSSERSSGSWRDLEKWFKDSPARTKRSSSKEESSGENGRRSPEKREMNTEERQIFMDTLERKAEALLPESAETDEPFERFSPVEAQDYPKSEETRRIECARLIKRRDSDESIRSDISDSTLKSDTSALFASLVEQQGSPRSRSDSLFAALVEQDTSRSRSESVEWQDVVSTVRRRLLKNVQDDVNKQFIQEQKLPMTSILDTSTSMSSTQSSPAFPLKAIVTSPQSQKSPMSEPSLSFSETMGSPTMSEFGSSQEAVSSMVMEPRMTTRQMSMTAIPTTEEEAASCQSTTTIGGRSINIGLFKQLNKFPFTSQTIPVPASRMYEARRAIGPEDRMFVRPHAFGREKPLYSRRRGIHFGPPRNPQCSCENCRNWAGRSQESSGQLLGSRVRAWSLTDLGVDTTSGAIISQQPLEGLDVQSFRSYSSNTTDYTPANTHLGSTESGREQS